MSEIIDLYEMPTDAYKALKALAPEHELCKLYEKEWLAKGAKPGIVARYATEENTLAQVIVNFANAMWAEVEALKGRPSEFEEPKTQLTIKDETLPETSRIPITW